MHLENAKRFALALCVLLSLTPALAAEEAAILLTARADLPDPRFRGTVVLVANNLGPGPVGVILNRPTRMPLSRLFPEIAPLAHRDGKVYYGGPVEAASISFLFRADTAPENATRVVDGVYFSRDLDLLRTLFAREKPTEGLRVFAGYAGWHPLQLQGELARGDWTIEPARPEAVFAPRPERPWPDDEGAAPLHRG